MIEAVRLLGLLTLCCALSACYNPSYGDCQVSCASGTCPAGLECQSGVCRAPGMTGPCTTTDGGIDAAGLSLDELMEATFESLCRYMVRCGQFEDAATCEMLYGNLSIRQNDVSAAVQSGSVIFHGDVAKACLDTRDSLGCERWKGLSNRAFDASCMTVFEGTRHDGESCAINEQCISQTCMLEACAMACCPGTCVGDRPPGTREPGEACTQLDRCQNSYCDQLTAVCTAYKAAGEECTYGDQCADGYGCIPTAQFPTGSCTMLVDTNGPCSQSGQCLMLGDVCKNGACMTGGLEGSTCTTQGECQMFHGCSNNRCAKPPGFGESCIGAGVCAEGYCSYDTDPTTPICAPKKPDLGTCAQNQQGLECESGYCNAGKCDQKPVCN